MKITCHACDAKYTIADEKVTGRTVKIKCKKCGATIVVAADQAAGGGATAAPPQAHGGGEDDMMATRVAGQDGAPPAINAPEWTVSIAEGQEQQMSQLQLAEAMQHGTVTGDTYVWRDGMPDWLSVSQVPELAALLARAAAPPAMTAPGGYAAAAAAAAVPGPGQVEDEPHLGLAGTMVMTESPMMSPMAAAPSAPRPAAGMPAVETPSAVSSSPGLAGVNQPTAARRANRADRPSVDVFQAAAEGQPQREPEKQRPKPPTPAGRLGERNENSVLFSLSALTATENAAKSSPSDDSIDLGFGGGNKNGKSAVDDLMNIGGGAIGGPMLAPPPLLAPVVEPPPAPAPVAVPAAAPAATMGPASFAQPAPQPKSKTGLIIGIVAAVAVIGGVGAFFALSGGGGGSGATTDATTPTASVTSAAANTTSAAAVTSAPAATDAPAANGDASPTSSAVASNDSSKTQGTTAGGAATSTKAGVAATGAPTASAKASSTPSSAPTPTAAPTATDTGGGGGRDFNKGAATTALSAAAGRAKGCKTADGPTGSASVRVVFAPSGNVTSANVQGPPFAGTPVGGCIAAAFRGASVPPFDGSPVAVSKTVNIN